MKRQSVNRLMNNFHKVFVYTCIGGTLYGLFLLSWRFGTYFTVVRPQLKEKAEREKLLLLQEGKDIGLTVEDAAPDMQV